MTGTAGRTAITAPWVDLDSVVRLLDPHTTANLTTHPLPSGARCWTIGPATGAVARYLAGRAEVGRVLATEADLSLLIPAAPAGVVVSNDTGLSVADGGPFDLIHVRLFLALRPRPGEIIRQLTAALRPGGWLMVEDFACDEPLRLLTTASRGDEELLHDTDLFHDIHDRILAVLAELGLSPTWVWVAHETLADVGFVDITMAARAEAAPAGSRWTLLYQATVSHLAPALRERGVTTAELDAFGRLLVDPTFTTMNYPLVSTWGHTTH